MKKLVYAKGILALAMSGNIGLLFATQTFENTMRRLDRNVDGHISIKEAVADPAMLKSFNRIDTDGNGIISATELANQRFRETIARAKS